MLHLELPPAGPTLLPVNPLTLMAQPTARFFFSYYFYYANA
ncbi:hypothetical protein [Hymenobacter pini]|nr:hypothetical protein [Hymenobacter pini]